MSFTSLGFVLPGLTFLDPLSMLLATDDELVVRRDLCRNSLIGQSHFPGPTAGGATACCPNHRSRLHPSSSQSFPAPGQGKCQGRAAALP